MNIAFVIENVPRLYSGGRVHGWLIIHALTAMGHRVTAYTEGRPPFYDGMGALSPQPGLNVQRPLKNLSIKDPVDIICSFPILATAWADREARRLKVPHAAWVLDPYVMCKKYAPAVASRMHYGEDYLQALRRADWIVASDNAAVPFIHQWTQHKNIVPWTPSINSMAADQKRGAGEKKRNVVAITRLTEHKNFSHIVEALAAVQCTGTIITSFDAGRMRQTISRRGLAGRVKVVDKPDEAEKFRLFWSSPVFLSASQYEGLGLPQMEAMYCGSRPVVYDFPVMREICGDVALYARWRDVGHLTERLREALELSDREEVRKAGQRYRFEQMLKRAPAWISA